MKKSDFSFELPQELIAQTPMQKRENSRLLCLDRKTGKTDHRRFYELPQLLREGDCLILNDSRVMPARLLGDREGGGAVEIVLLRERNLRFGIRNPELTSPTWECLVKPGKKIKIGTKLIFGDGALTGTVISEAEDGNRLIEFECHPVHLADGSQDDAQGIFLEILEKLGKMPLPPYIRKELSDSERYQTVYSRVSGSAAAPTAGLHFTHKLLDEIAARGVSINYITLHVGLGTFRPVTADRIEEHNMHAEYFIIPDETALAVNRTKVCGGRVIAVGTTSCRALEAIAGKSGAIGAFSGFTDIFIYPGYEYKCIDGLITNFHLPESTLIMLVSAFAGRENTLSAYNEAIRKRYRFFSFGDAMLIV